MSTTHNHIVPLIKRSRKVSTPIKITNSMGAEALFKKMWDADSIKRYESFYVIYLNDNGEVLKHNLLNIGSKKTVSINTRRLIGDAYLLDADNFIIAHNHPSGNPNPGSEDLEHTKNLRYICEAMEMTLLDHLILTADGYYSFKDNGHL